MRDYKKNSVSLTGGVSLATGVMIGAFLPCLIRWLSWQVTVSFCFSNSGII